MIAALLSHATRNPNGIAASDGMRSLTWRALYDEVEKTRVSLSGKVGGTDRIAVVGMRPSLAALPWIHALPAAGVTPLFVNPQSTLAELAGIAERFPVSLVVGGEESWRDVFPWVEPGPAAPPGILPSGILLLTSGTSGTPKAARLSLNSFRAHAEASRLHLSLSTDDSWLAAMPLHHVGGLTVLLRAAYLGCRVEIREQFNAAEANRLLDDGTVSHLSVVPTTLQRLLADRKGRPFPRSVKCILTGGAALPASTADAARKLGAPVAPTYGLTEACSQVATLLPHEFLSGESRGATLLPGVEAAIRNAQGTKLPDGEEGEIWLRSPFLFQNYWGGGSPLDSERWYGTGDIGVLKNGRLQLLDRRTDLIVSGGENVYPSEVERCLREIEGVHDCAVIGLPDSHWGARVTAVIEGTTPDIAGILAHCRARLSPFKIPKEVLFVAQMPRTPSGKIQHQVLRDRFTAAHPNDSVRP